MNVILFPHQFNVPLFFGVVTKVLFAVSPQVPLADYFPLSERKSLTFFGMNKYVLTSAKLAVADLFAPLLRLAAAPSTYWSSFSTFSHIDSNVMRDRGLSLRLSVKHYETSERMLMLFMSYFSKSANNLIDITIRNVFYFFLVIDGKKVNACVSCLNNNVQSDNPKSSPLATTFALDTKSNLTLAPTKRNSCLWILHQFKLKVVDVIGKRAITFCQTFGLTQKFLSIVKSNHSLSRFCSEFFDQCVEGSKAFARKASFLSFTVASFNSLCYKGFFLLNILRGCYQPVNGHSFNSTQNLFQARKQVRILNI